MVLMMLLCLYRVSAAMPAPSLVTRVSRDITKMLIPLTCVQSVLKVISVLTPLPPLSAVLLDNIKVSQGRQLVMK